MLCWAAESPAASSRPTARKHAARAMLSARFRICRYLLPCRSVPSSSGDGINWRRGRLPGRCCNSHANLLQHLCIDSARAATLSRQVTDCQIDTVNSKCGADSDRVQLYAMLEESAVQFDPHVSLAGHYDRLAGRHDRLRQNRLCRAIQS